jgi:hypothetical protein
MPLVIGALSGAQTVTEGNKKNCPTISGKARGAAYSARLCGFYNSDLGPRRSAITVIAMGNDRISGVLLAVWFLRHPEGLDTDGLLSADRRRSG